MPPTPSSGITSSALAGSAPSSAGGTRSCSPAPSSGCSAASHSALSRGDADEAVAALERALALVEAEARVELLPAFGAALFEAGRMTEAAEVLDEAVAQAAGPRAQVEREFVRLESETSVGTEQAERVATAALPALAGDERGQCRAWSLQAQVAWIGGQVGRADAAWVEAARCARNARDDRLRFGIVGWRATAAVLGPTPVADAIERCEGFREELGASPVAVAWAINPLASLHAMRGDFELAERLLRQAKATLDELGSLNASVNHHEALVWLLAGRPDLAEAALRPTAERLSSIGDEGLLATTSAMLAQALFALERFDEAGECCALAERAGAADDIVTQVVWRGVLAKVLARAGNGERAEALAREAVALAEPTDLLTYRGDAMLDLGEVLRLRSREEESELATRRGLALHALKGNVVRSRNPLGED